MNETLEYYTYRFLYSARTCTPNMPNTRQVLSYKKSIIFAACCMYIGIVAVYHSTGKGKSLRGAVMNSEDELQMMEVSSVIRKAEDEVLDNANGVLSVMEDDIDKAEGTLHFDIKKSLDDFLLNQKKLSVSKTIEIEDKVLDAVDHKVSSIVNKEENELEDSANNNLDLLDVEALKGESDGTNDDVPEVDQPKLDNMKVDLEKYLKNEIARSENRVFQSLGKVTEEAEAMIFQDEGIDVSAGELNALVEQETKNVKKPNSTISKDQESETKNATSLVEEAEDEVLDVANDKIATMENDVNSAEGDLKDKIQKVLHEFLVDRKDLPTSKAQEIEEKVLEKVDDRVTSLLNKEETDIEVVANENLDLLDEEALGSESKDIDGDNASKVNQFKLGYLKKDLEEYLKKEISDSENRVIESLGEVTKDVETQVLNEEGVHVSAAELAALAKQTSSIKKSEPTTSTTQESDSNKVSSVVTKAEDEVLEKANDELDVIAEDVDVTEENLFKGIKNTLDDFLINEKKLSPLQAEKVEEKINMGIDNKVTSIMGNMENDISTMVNDNLDAMDDEALKDNSSSKLDNMKEGLEKHVKEEIDESEKQLIQSLGEVTRDVESKVFDEEGIDVSTTELTSLVEKETKDIKKTELIG